ncbi:type II toxin-antitoxin system HicA family toxin [Companilactobacillus sp.]|uniref:type II toxin-antitoxin system HicA family toxin n=1 Tax=Companilactobacillus sp. TaxID=2767905 RepID=UPI0025C28298|nr:type II toxin-antitoxin system HicA family toxin [Companilactobacillus sp.]MCH4009952.1 type II toxin-antitoxin system HicA family toxin [Companilactobacillus sp.]MCH4052372.1 type II toxin-antitoxin system HicA family toxin [Companilactobacillus sp.]MCH4077894.1 type II toxin-antitoxin system HicA family toxin [Companilactobacillus sp.]MCH4126470.1 type II toxin-antitoxin system HicA family toxin [Companilactobacillus sp.]MCH4132056.1 type II toxin-antitoxin system HicA family toxin [Compa
MAMKPRKLLKLMRNNGFVEKSQTGSHLKMYNPNTNVTVPVPVHFDKEYEHGIESKILKQAGINLNKPTQQ